MKDINGLKREIAEMTIKGVNIQDILNELQGTDWNIWIEEAKERNFPVVACASCCHNMIADVYRLSSTGYICDACINESEDQYANTQLACKTCGSTHARKSFIAISVPTNTSIHTKSVKICPDKIDEATDEYKTNCMRCNKRYLPFASKILCDSCYITKYAKEASRVLAHNQRTNELGLDSDLTLSQWLSALDYFDWKCAYNPKHKFRDLEHYLPVELGGGTTAYNCIPSCGTCNAKKHDCHPDQLDRIFPSDNLAHIRDYLSKQAA